MNPAIPVFRAVGAVVLGLSSLASSLEAREEVNGIAAVVNGKVITKSELRDARLATEQMIMVTVPPGATREKQIAEARSKAMDQLIEREVVLYEFAKLGGTVKPSMVEEDIKKIIRERFEGKREMLISELKKTGMTLAKFEELRRKMISIQVMRAQQGRDIVYATPDDVKAAYEKNKDAMRSLGSVTVRMISIAKQPVVPAAEGLDIQEIAPDPAQRRKLAEEIRGKLLAGADFPEMAEKFSDDPKAKEGGYRGVITAADKDFRKDLAAVAFSLKTGEISSIVEDNYNFYILKADNREMGPAPSFDDPKVKEAMENAALGELREAAVKKWIEHLIKQAQIKKYD